MHHLPAIRRRRGSDTRSSRSTRHTRWRARSAWRDTSLDRSPNGVVIRTNNHRGGCSSESWGCGRYYLRDEAGETARDQRARRRVEPRRERLELLLDRRLGKEHRAVLRNDAHLRCSPHPRAPPRRPRNPTAARGDRSRHHRATEGGGGTRTRANGTRRAAASITKSGGGRDRAATAMDGDGKAIRRRRGRTATCVPCSPRCRARSRSCPPPP